MRDHNVPEDMPIRKKYLTRAAEWYRENLLAEAEGRSGPVPLELGTGHLPVVSTTACHAAVSAGVDEQLLLDRVDAAAPPVGTMTSGGVSSGTCSMYRDARLHSESLVAADDGQSAHFGQRFCK